MKIEDRFALTTGFWSTFGSISEQEPDKKEAALQAVAILNSPYFMSILDAMGAIISLHIEICSTLEEIEGRQTVFARVATLEQLTAGIKYYALSWSTMTDLLARLLNGVFDIGLQGRDVSLPLLQRNTHIAKSQVAPLLQQYSSSTAYRQVKEQRNSVTHRGGVGDRDVEALQQKMNTLLGRQSILSEKKLPEDEFQRQYDAITGEVWSLAKEKREAYRAHYEGLVRLFQDVMPVLARKAYDCGKRNITNR